MSNKCKIIYNNQGERIGVQEIGSNNPSQTFQDILNDSHTKNFDEALQIYKNLYSEDIEFITERVADKLPLTLPVFDLKQFAEMRGKMVNPITVQQSLNQAGIKQIEKDLINQVIEDNYKGQKKISFDELETTVRANIMPLERITTSSYADYGMDNLGSGNYGEAKTLILNAPIEHGVTGHFSGDFKASGRQNIKYVPKQLNDNVWVAVEEGYEANANDNNIYQYVGTAGTKEAVDVWINQYNGGREVLSVSDTTIEYNIIYPTGYDSDVQITRQIAVDLGRGNDYLGSAQIEYDENLSEEQIKKLAVDIINQKNKNRFTDNYESNINKGMFGHIRVWQDGQDYYVAELQSDYFQKNNARKDIVDKATRESEEFKKLQQTATEIGNIFREEKAKLEEQNKKELLDFAKKQPNVEFKLEKTFNDDEKYNLRLFIDNKQIHTYRYKFSENQSTEEAEKEIINSTYSVNEYLPQNVVDYKKELENKVLELENKFDKEKNDLNKKIEKIRESVFNKLSPQEKQFIASQKEWEKRMVREAIKEASLSGATSLRFPTPYTLSVIEGYLSEGAPYEIENANNSTYLEAGDRIYYAGEDYTVVDSDSTTITIAESGRVSSSLDEDIISQEVDNAVDNDMYEIENNLRDFYTQEEWNDFRDNYSPISSTELDEVGNEIEEGVFEVSEGKIRDIVSEYYNNIFTDAESIIKDIYGNDVWVNGNTVTWTDGTANIETLMQPSEYKGQGTKDSFSIEDDLDDTQQTVARKYEEIAEILKKEKPVEIVTDENGFDWYEAPITQEDTQNPVVAFSLSQADPILKYQTEEGNVFNSYAEALRNTNGNEIKTGVNTVNGFQEIYSKSTNTNVDTQDGLINHLIKTGILSDKSYKENGKTYLIPEGRNFAKKRINAENIKDAFQKQLGIKSAKLKADSSIELNEDQQRNKVTVTAKNGEQVTVDISELNAPFSELKKKFDTYTIATALASDAVQKEMSKKTEVTPTELVPENELQEKLLNLLNRFGIKQLSIEAYQKQYNKRNELPISARALADIANKIVAFKDGIIENDDLVEETAHLIVASIPEAQKENLKRNIHKTKEWSEYAKQYEGVYATEDELREEILGKVVANAIKEKFAQRESNQTENAIIAKIKELFEAFLQNIRNFFQDSFQTELDKLNNDIFNNLFAETLDLNLESANGIFFNANEASLSANRLAEKTLKLIDIVKQQERSLTKKYKNPANNATIKSAERLLNFKAEPSISTGLKAQATQEIESEYPNESDSKKTELIQNRVVKLAEDLAKKQEESEKLNGVAQFIRLVSSQVNQLKDSANKKREDERPFDAQENPVYQTLIKRIRPALNSVKTMLDNKDKLQSEIISEIDKINNELGLIESKVKDSIEPTVLRMTEELIDRYSMTDKEADEYREIVRSALRGEMKDTDTIHTYIGSLTMAKNPILNMAGGVQKRMTINANDDMQRSSKPFIDAVKNLTQSQWKKLVKEDEYFKGDSEQLELVSEIDSKKLNKELENIKKKLGKELLEKEKEAVNTQTDLSTNYNIFLNQDGSVKEDIYDEKGGIKEELKDDYDLFIKDFNGLYKEYVESEKETFFTEDYLKRLKKHSLTINGEKKPIMSEQSIQIYKDFQREITQIYMNAGGQNLSQSDLENKKEIERRRTEASNPRDSSGEFIKGVTEIYDNNLGKYVVIIDKNVKFDNDQEKQKAFVLVGLNNYMLKTRDFQSLESTFEAYSQLPIEQQIVTVEKDKDGDFTQNYLNEVRDYYTSLGFSRDIPQKFLNELNSFQTTEEKVSFLERNSYISFPDSYYEQFKQYPGLLDKLRTEGSEEALKLEKDIRKYQSIINRILRENRVHNRPAEINVMEMSQVQKNEVKFAQTQIDELMLKSRAILTDDVVDREIAVENKPNQSYFDYLKDSGVDELSYIMDNSTIKGRSAIEKAIAITKGAPITKGYSKWFNNNMDENEMNFALIQYARTKLLPYLKKSEPFYVDENGKRVTYTDEFNRLFDKKNPLRVEDWINEKRLVKISPDLSYFETSQRRNPNWKEDYHNYKPEFLAKIKDDRFEAIQKDTTLKTAYDAIIKYNDYQRENNNLTGIGNRFAVPGVRKTDIERLKSLKAGAITEIFKDFMEFREEEQEFLGSTKSEIYSPPTYYNRPLENKDEQTTNYMYAFLMYGKMATLHKHRRENLPDMYLLQDALHNTDTTSKNAIKMFDNYMDFNFFGKREEFSKKILGGRVDLGKVIKTMNNWSKMVNLSGFVVPLTNFSQNTIAKNMERFIGEIITPEASNKGNKLFIDLGKQTAKEVLGFDSKSVGNVMLESFGLYDLVHRFENSQFGKTTRGFLKTIQGNALHELANFPITERLMYGIISDYKYVDGKILHFTVFKKKMDAENFKGDLKQKWSEYKDFNMDFISAVKNGVLDVASDEMIEKVRKNGITGTDEEIKKYLETRRTDIALRVTSAITQLDAQVPQDERSIASRNPIASLFLNHLGFLMTGYQRRFKERNYEFGREGFTEGTYRTLANFASKIMLKPKDFRAIYNQLDTNQQKNLKRVLVELGYINALVFIGLLLMGMDDDDDNLYITELADLFSNRLAVETIGSSIGIGSTMYGVFDNPLMLKQKIKQWSEVGDLTEDEKRYKYLSNLLPFMRDIDKLSNPTDARQKYMHYQNDEKGTYKYYGWISHFMVDYDEQNK